MNKAESLAKVSKELMLKEPYYGFFLIMLNKLWSDNIPTACVGKQGINYQLLINVEFWENLNHLERMGLLKHELLHIAFKHLSIVFKFSDRKLANIAMDCEINQYIESDWLPEGGIDIADYPELNLDAKAGCRYYYDKMQEAKKEKEEKGSSGCPNFDKLLDQEELQPNHDGWDEFEEVSEVEHQLIERQTNRLLNDAMAQTLAKAGTIPGEIKGIIEMSKIEKPKFDWRKYVRRFTGSSTKVFTKKQRRKENRKYPDSPGLKVKMRQKMLLAIDTSGSVNNTELREFMNEIYHIWKAGVDVVIMQCDTRINSILEYKGEFELEITGRGGTEFDPVLEYYNEHPAFTSLVYFTDGECGYSVKPKKRVLWVLSEQSTMNESLPGKVIKLEL